VEAIMAGSVLITGASGGLGGAVVSRFLEDGWRVVALSRSGLLPGVASTPDAPAVAVAADANDADQVASAVAVAAGLPQAPLTAVVNLIGGYSGGARAHETDVAAFDAQLRLNLRPAYLVTATALPHLIAAGGGSVVCVGSRASQRPFAGAAGYIAAKTALLGLVDALAVEYRNDAVRVNAVLPSTIDTPANRAGQPGADFSTWVTPQRVADVIAFLCSDAAAATSGAHVPVYGRG
jgi:NAD(P)-dependent dehydrogenase (short-subunit alcohol dehydrogenase family)